MNEKIAQNSVRGEVCPFEPKCIASSFLLAKPKTKGFMHEVKGERLKVEGLGADSDELKEVKGESKKVKASMVMQNARAVGKNQLSAAGDREISAAVGSNRGVRKAMRFKRGVRRFKNSKVAAAIAGIVLLIMLSLNMMAQTALSVQTNPIQVKPLLLQQRVPKEMLNKNFAVINAGEGIDSLLLASFAGKVVLLDFWATYCTPCVKKFAYLDSLQQRFKDKLVILLVNSAIKGDTREKMLVKLAGYNIPSIVFDKYLRTLFPYDYIPHCIWIDTDGKLAAVTTSDQVNDAMVTALWKPLNKLN